MTDLYIMERSDAPGIIKVGSSQDPERRRRQLEEGHTFRMSVVAVFPGAGQFEHCVHRKLAYARVMTGAGRVVPSVALRRIPSSCRYSFPANHASKSGCGSHATTMLGRIRLVWDSGFAAGRRVASLAHGDEGGEGGRWGL